MVEAEEPDDVFTEHGSDFRFREIMERIEHLLGGGGPGAFRMRIVAAPHDLFDADLMADFDIGPADARCPDADVARLLRGADR